MHVDPRCNPLPRAHPCDARWTLATPSHMLEDLALACGIDLPSFSILTPTGSCGKAEGGGESKEAITHAACVWEGLWFLRCSPPGWEVADVRSIVVFLRQTATQNWTLQIKGGWF